MIRFKSIWKRALLSLIALALLLTGIWLYAGIRFGIWNSVDYDRYEELTQGISIARSLWHGQIRAGANAEKIIAVWKPDELQRFDRWIDMAWYPGGPITNGFSFIGISAIAHDGVLICAASYSDDGLMRRIFFSKLTPADQLAYQAALNVYYAKRLGTQPAKPTTP